MMARPPVENRHYTVRCRTMQAGSVRAVTLVEMLVVVSVIALLLGVLIPVIRSARGQMKMIKCSSNLRSLAMEFQFFAEGQSAAGQGDSELLGRGRFFINDFQDSVYGLDEFWNLGEASSGELSVRKDLMLCAAGAPRLTKRRGFPCGGEAMQPAEDVSIAVNMRLYRGVLRVGGVSVLAPVAITEVGSDILNHPYVPLLIDVDGGAAMARGLDPFYTAPPGADPDDPYSSGRYWMPSDRHEGRTNVAFVGGHVLSSASPGRERWNWGYQAHIGH